MLLPAFLLAATLTIRDVATIPPRIGEGAFGRLLALDSRGGVTTAVYTHVPPLAGAQSELAATRIAADGSSGTTSIAPLFPLGDINYGGGAATSHGYLVTWYDGAIEKAFIDSSLQLTRPVVTLSATGKYPNVACNERRCLVTWRENDSLAGALFDDTGKMLRHIDFGKVQAAVKPAASSSGFMLPVWRLGDDETPKPQLLPVDDDGNAGDPVTITLDSPVIAIDAIDGGFAVVEIVPGEEENTLFAENLDTNGAVLQPWRTIGHTPPVFPIGLNLGGRGPGRVLVITSLENTVVITGAIPDTFLYAIRLGAGLQAIDETPLTVSRYPIVNDVPLIAGESPHYLVGWSHGVGQGLRSYRDTTPCLAPIDDLRGTFPLITGPVAPIALGSVPSGDGYDVLFGDRPWRSGDITSMFLTHISRNGTIGSTTIIAGDGSYRSTLATNGDELLVAWLSEKGLSTRAIGADRIPGPRYDSPADILLSDVVWDGAEYAAIIRIGFDYFIRTFDRHGKPMPLTEFCSGGDTSLIAASNTRIATAVSCNAHPYLLIFNGAIGGVIRQTLLPDSFQPHQIRVKGDHFVLFGYHSVMEFDRDGNPIGTPLETGEPFFDPVLPFGNGFAILGRTVSETSVRSFDLDRRTVGDAVTFGGRFDDAWPGAAGTLLLVRYDYLDATISLRELALSGALTRRRAF